MSLATLVPTAIGGAQAAAASASIVKNILAGLAPNLAGISALVQLNKDIGGFAFDYIGEERLDAGTEITDHYNESNDFMQDHCAVKPTILTMRGFAAEVTYNKTSTIPALLALSTALAPVTPYLGRYSAGASAAMLQAVTQTDKILNQLGQVQSLYGSVTKLVGGAPVSKIQQAYNKLDALRTGGATFVAVTPWGVFDGRPGSRHGQVMIDSLVMIQPEDTRQWADIIVRLKEIRVAPSLFTSVLDNSRGSQLPAVNGTVSAGTA